MVAGPWAPVEENTCTRCSCRCLCPPPHPRLRQRLPSPSLAPASASRCPTQAWPAAARCAGPTTAPCPPSQGTCVLRPFVEALSQGPWSQSTAGRKRPLGGGGGGGVVLTQWGGGAPQGLGAGVGAGVGWDGVGGGVRGEGWGEGWGWDGMGGGVGEGEKGWGGMGWGMGWGEDTALQGLWEQPKACRHKPVWTGSDQSRPSHPGRQRQTLHAASQSRPVAGPGSCPLSPSLGPLTQGSRSAPRP